MLMFCPSCRLQQPTDHRFCVSCGVLLPRELIKEPRAKSARFYAGVKVAPDDAEHAFLRVSCYLKEQTFESQEGSVTIPGRHVRFSVWVNDESRCVISIPESEARDLADFVAAELARLNGDDTQPLSTV